MTWVGVRAHQALRLVLDLGLDQLRIRKRLSIPAANNNDSEGNMTAPQLRGEGRCQTEAQGVVEVAPEQKTGADSFP